MDIKEIIILKYGSNTIAWAKKTYKLKSLPAAKSQKFVEFPGAQRARWTKFLELEFFIWKGKAT